MEKYSIKKFKKDFIFVNNISYTTKGTRKKRIVIDKNFRKAFFKYKGDGYNVSEACSEKLSYEIAMVLGYKCAEIELARDERGVLGILNYWFINENTVHNDIKDFLSIFEKERQKFYTISNIKLTLDSMGDELFNDFIKIMIFDALVGEFDRHEENWGVENIDGKFQISPLYDNGSNLLGEFQNEQFAEKYYSNIRDFESYILKSPTQIFKENSNKKYKHFELIKYLYTTNSLFVKKEIQNLKKLTNQKIEIIVNKIPDELLTDIHKKYIIIYLKRRRDILLEITKGDLDEK